MRLLTCRQASEVEDSLHAPHVLSEIITNLGQLVHTPHSHTHTDTDTDMKLLHELGEVRVCAKTIFGYCTCAFVGVSLQQQLKLSCLLQYVLIKGQNNVQIFGLLCLKVLKHLRV